MEGGRTVARNLSPRRIERSRGCGRSPSGTGWPPRTGRPRRPRGSAPRLASRVVDPERRAVADDFTRLGRLGSSNASCRAWRTRRVPAVGAEAPRQRIPKAALCVVCSKFADEIHARRRRRPARAVGRPFNPRSPGQSRAAGRCIGCHGPMPVGLAPVSGRDPTAIASGGQGAADRIQPVARAQKRGLRIALLGLIFGATDRSGRRPREAWYRPGDRRRLPAPSVRSSARRGCSRPSADAGRTRWTHCGSR